MDWVKVSKISHKVNYINFLPIINGQIQGIYSKDELYDAKNLYHEYYNFTDTYGEVIEEFNYIDLKTKFLETVSSYVPFQFGMTKVVIVIAHVAGVVVVNGPRGPFVSEKIVGELELELERIDNYLLEKIFEHKKSFEAK